MRITVSIGLVLIICGCAHQPDTQPEPQKWQRVSPLPDCLSDVRYRGPSEDIPIVLGENFKAQLMQQVPGQDLQEPFCWYETPSGEVLLRAGSTCNCPLDFHFLNVASGWSLTRINVFQCDVRCEELDNIRIDPTS